MPIDYLASLRADAELLSATAGGGPLDADVPSCPGWDVNRLVGHMGRIHRWATEACRTGAEPVADRLEKPPRDETVLPWFDAGIEPLVQALTVLDPDAHVWNFSNGHQDGRFWPRRMAIETAIHRWDGQDAHGAVTPIDPELASDGMDELLDVHVGLRLAGRDGIDIGGSVHFHCTDTPGEWTVRTDDGLARVTRGHTKGDVAVRGPASSLLLMQWRRIPPDDPSLEILGDRDVFDRWLALPVPQ
jgi:uncharacterized protein (TIGR03083 family)